MRRSPILIYTSPKVSPSFAPHLQVLVAWGDIAWLGLQETGLEVSASHGASVNESGEQVSLSFTPGWFSQNVPNNQV